MAIPMHVATADALAHPAQLVDLESLQPIETRKRMRRHVWTRTRFLFLVIVAVPTLCAVVYYTLIAADQYASETRFLVRSPNHNVAGFLSGFLQSTGFVRAQDDSYSVTDFIRSRAAVEELVRQDRLKAIYSRSEADFLARFPSFWVVDTREALFRHYLKFIKISTDSGSGITTLEVRAFRAADAQALARALLLHAEQLVNRLNDRARQDAVRYAKAEVANGAVRLAAAQRKVTAFRNSVAMIDPGSQSNSMLDLVAKLMSDVADDKARLKQFENEAPKSPQVAALRARIAATESQIRAERARVVGGDSSIAPRIAEYEQLLLERDIATRMLATATTSLENAKLDAQRQQLYLERIVEPHLPDHATYPKAVYAVLLTFGLSLACFTIVMILLAHVRERPSC